MRGGQVGLAISYSKSGLPLRASLASPTGSKTWDLFAPKTGLSIYEIERRVAIIRTTVDRLLVQGVRVVVPGFLRFLGGFDFNYVGAIEAYDPNPQLPNKFDVEKYAIACASLPTAPWQWLIANSALVYERLRRRGVLVGGLPRFPQWSQDTWSGRSKTTVYNIQGATDKDEITNPSGKPDDYLIHFDWRGVDIRTAALLSEDPKLLELTLTADIYESVREYVGDCDVSRDELKTALLMSINSLDIEAPIIQLFPVLRQWMRRCKEILESGGTIKTLLGRPFRVRQGRSLLSAFNAGMQGTVAQAMQHCIIRLWEIFGERLLADVHDSLVITSGRTDVAVAQTVRDTTNIMLHPFRGLLDSDPCYPVKVSVGNKWRQWKGCFMFAGDV